MASKTMSPAAIPDIAQDSWPSEDCRRPLLVSAAPVRHHGAAPAGRRLLLQDAEIRDVLQKGLMRAQELRGFDVLF